MLKEKDAEPDRGGRQGRVSLRSSRRRCSQPQFEGQTKTKLGNTEIRSFVERALNQMFPEWLERHSGEGRRIIDKAATAAKARQAARQARDLTRRKSLLESSGSAREAR